ncbi:Fe-S cluster assembly protein SufD [Photobacterium chitinilyticum]|uniref:Fe-S cluster assembly protein SufD n=1 Tax=Photobacterium chitinilyticum TaxID=2485123 RepID=UPI003D0C550A
MDGSLMQNKQMYKGKLPKYNHIDDSGLKSLYLALGERSQFQQSQWKQLAEKGIPTNKHEDWKYTPLNLMIQPSRCWANRVMGIDDYLDAKILQLSIPLNANLLVFVDGAYRTEHSKIVSSESLSVMPMDSWNTDQRRDIDQGIATDFVSQMSEALAQDGVYIRVRKGAQLVQPIYLLHLHTCKPHAAAHYRHHFHLAMHAQAELIEHYVSLSDTEVFSNSSDVSESAKISASTGSRLTVNVASNAKLQHIKIVEENSHHVHFAHNDIHMGHDASAVSHVYFLQGQCCRHQTSARFKGDNAYLSMNSLVLPKQQDVFDSRTYTEHCLPYCRSEQLHKVIASDRGKGIFDGMILVSKGAIKTDGQMDNRNLLLGEQSQVFSKPKLEIYADDVKCSHGATTGSIDPEQLGYMQARGMSKAAAKHVLTQAFAFDVVDQHKVLTHSDDHDTLAVWLKDRIAERLAL